MKYSRKLLLFTLLLLILVCLFGGCQKSEKSQVKAAATRELDLLKDLDDKTIEKYISYEDLYLRGNPSGSFLKNQKYILQVL